MKTPAFDRRLLLPESVPTGLHSVDDQLMIKGIFLGNLEITTLPDQGFLDRSSGEALAAVLHPTHCLCAATLL